jgi:hypothetical protein
MLAVDAATLLSRTSTANFENANSLSRSWRALEKTLKAISIEQRSSVGTFDRDSGLIRVYHGPEGWIDFCCRSVEQPEWEPLLAFIHETTERFLPSPLVTNWDVLDELQPEEPAQRGQELYFNPEIATRDSPHGSAVR